MKPLYCFRNKKSGVALPALPKIALICAIPLIFMGSGCDGNKTSAGSDPGDLKDAELPYLLIEGMDLKAGVDTMAISAWVNTTYIPILKAYQGCERVLRYLQLPDGMILEPLSGGLTFLFFTSRDKMGQTSIAPGIAAIEDTVGKTWKNGECSIPWKACYEKIKSWTREGSDTNVAFITWITTNIKPESEKDVTLWYNDTYIPTTMGYPGLSKIVRYRKIAGVGYNDADRPQYILLYYYGGAGGLEGIFTDRNFNKAESYRNSRWTSGELTVGTVANFVCVAR